MLLIAILLGFLIKFCQLQSTPIKFLLVRDKGQEYAVNWLRESLEKEKDASAVDFKDIVLGENETDNALAVCNGLSEASAFIIDISLGNEDELTKVSETFGIPYVRINFGINPALKLLDKYLELRNSSDVAIIFDNPEHVDQALFYWIDSTRLRLLVSDNLDQTSARKLRKLRPTPNNFAIIATAKRTEILYKRALAERLVEIPERWSLVFLDFDYEQNFDYESLLNEPINLLSFSEEMCCKSNCTCAQDFNLEKATYQSSLNQIFKVITSRKNVNFVNITCEGSGNTRYDNKARRSFDKTLSEFIEHQNVLIYEQHTLTAKLIGNMDIMRRSGKLERIAIYSDDGGMEITTNVSIKPITPFYRVGMTHAIPWSFKEKDASTGELKWTGYCVDFIQRLSEELNFNYEIVEPLNGTFGHKYHDGYWDGVIGDLARGETDIGLTALVMTADREEVVDFIAPYFEQSGITIVMRKPVRKTSLFKFMTVLKLEVWLSIIAALVMTGLMVWFLDKYSPYSSRNNKDAYPYPCREFTLKESFWFALTSFTPQGGGEAPKSLSGRTLVAAYWLFVVLMLATFTANLAAFLTVERMQTPIQSLEQLAKQSRINYTVVNNSDTHSYFINMKHAEDTLFRLWKELTLNASADETQYRVWDYPIREQYGHILMSINESLPVKDAEEGFRKVNEYLDGDFAFIHDSSEIKYEISKNCNLTQVGGVFAEKPYALALQQGSHLQDIFSATILNLQKERFFEYLQSKYWNHSVRGTCEYVDDNEGITLESLGGVFIATLFGLALAMITLVGEVVYYRKKKRKVVSKMDTVLKISVIGAKAAKNLKEKEIKKPLPQKSRLDLYPRVRNPITRVNN